MNINNTNLQASYQAYCDYIALKNHFTRRSYDYFKYNGKIITNTKNFLARRDRVFFDWLGRHDDCFHYLLSNFIDRPDLWVGDLRNNPQCKQNYTRWKTTIERLTYQFEQQITQLEEIDIKRWIEVPPNSHPLIVRLYLQKKLDPEIFVIIVDCLRCFSYWDATMKDDVVWDRVSLLYKKYKPFLVNKYDRLAMRKKLLDIGKRSLTSL